MKYMDRLGKAKDFKALEVMYKSNFGGSSYAANVTAQELDSDKAVVFCTTLGLGTSNWIDAMFGLRCHPKDKVIGYFKQMASTRCPEARYYCYILCSSEGWDDLVPYAMDDVNYKGPFSIPHQGLFDSLSATATEYIDKMKKKKE
jgi:hypothetical protein